MKLRDLGIGARFGLSCLILVILGGLAASAAHLYNHHENRDEQPGLSQTDIKGHYHGVRAESPLLKALQRNHPEEQEPEYRQLLIDWLNSDRISEDYDNLDLGDMAPAEIIAVDCLQCHGRASGEDIADEYPLDYWDDIRQIAFSREINPVDVKVLAASTHTHAISLGVLGVVAAMLLIATRLPAPLSGFLIAVTGFALAADIAAWWLTRSNESLTLVIIAAGGVFNAGTALMLLLTLLDLWWPKRRTPAPRNAD